MANTNSTGGTKLFKDGHYYSDATYVDRPIGTPLPTAVTPVATQQKSTGNNLALTAASTNPRSTYDYSGAIPSTNPRATSSATYSAFAPAVASTVAQTKSSTPTYSSWAPAVAATIAQTKSATPTTSTVEVQLPGKGNDGNAYTNVSASDFLGRIADAAKNAVSNLGSNISSNITNIGKKIEDQLYLAGLSENTSEYEPYTGGSGSGSRSSSGSRSGSGGGGGSSSSIPSTSTTTLSGIEGNPPVYTNRYEDQINALLEQIMNKEHFIYDFAQDPVYQQYAQNYMNLGKRSMEDTMGQAAALTGGYGSSYATSAGQQAYQQYLQELNNVIPELRNTAYEIWRDDRTDMETKLAMLNSLEQGDYAKFQDQLAQWNADRSYYYTKEQNASKKKSGGGGGKKSSSGDTSSKLGVTDVANFVKDYVDAGNYIADQVKSKIKSKLFKEKSHVEL